MEFVRGTDPEASPKRGFFGIFSSRIVGVDPRLPVIGNYVGFSCGDVHGPWV